jgi:hypothetical protein
MRPTPEQLWNYARKLALNSEYKGFGTKYPTVREASRRFRCRQMEIFEVAGEYQGEGYLGTASYFCEPPEPPGDHVVEAY